MGIKDEKISTKISGVRKRTILTWAILWLVALHWMVPVAQYEGSIESSKTIIGDTGYTVTTRAEADIDIIKNIYGKTWSSEYKFGKTTVNIKCNNDSGPITFVIGTGIYRAPDKVFGTFICTGIKKQHSFTIDINYGINRSYIFIISEHGSIKKSLHPTTAELGETLVEIHDKAESQKQ